MQCVGGITPHAAAVFAFTGLIYYSGQEHAACTSIVPALEREARIGRIVSIDGTLDRLCILYPRLALTLRHDETMRLNFKAGSVVAMTIKSPAWECEGHNYSGGYDKNPALNIRGRVTGFSVARAPTSWNPTVYVNVHCALETLWPEGETNLVLRLQHAKALNLKLRDTFLISLSDKYARTLA